MVKKESEIKFIAAPVEAVYAKMSDLRNLQSLTERLNDPQVQAMMAAQIPSDKIEQICAQLQNLEFEADSIAINSSMGRITLNIIEREEPKLLKFAASGAPIDLNLWIQLLPTDASNCKLKVTTGADVNFLMKAMVNKPLQQAADGLAQILAAVPYA